MTSTWIRRPWYALTALPVGLAALVLPGARARQARLADGLLGGPGRPRRALGLLLALPAFPLALLDVFLVGRIATYGLFWDSTGDDPSESWGGPSLLGAWVVHALVGLGIALIVHWLLGPLTRLHARPQASDLRRNAMSSA